MKSWEILVGAYPSCMMDYYNLLLRLLPNPQWDKMRFSTKLLKLTVLFRLNPLAAYCLLNELLQITLYLIKEGMLQLQFKWNIHNHNIPTHPTLSNPVFVISSKKKRKKKKGWGRIRLHVWNESGQQWTFLVLKQQTNGMLKQPKAFVWPWALEMLIYYFLQF